MGDHLFPVHNNFHIGAYQSAINAGADLSDLGETEATERDAFVYRAYIALGSHQARAVPRCAPAGQGDPLPRRCAHYPNASAFVLLAQLVISEISDSAPTALQAVKLFAIYTSQPAARVRPHCSAANPLRDPPTPARSATCPPGSNAAHPRRKACWSRWPRCCQTRRCRTTRRFCSWPRTLKR
jgi:hypothetical protein